MAVMRPNVTLQILSRPATDPATTAKRAWPFGRGTVPERRSVAQWGSAGLPRRRGLPDPQAKAGMVASMVLNS